MNSRLEKWLTISALTGWVASMGTLMVLAVRAAPQVSQPTQSLQRLASRSSKEVRAHINRTQVDESLRSIFMLQPQLKQTATLEPNLLMDASKKELIDSLKLRRQRSQPEEALEGK